MICDLCIVQLNVSYGFKRLALENDSKLRQYVIEKGIEELPVGYSTVSSAPALPSTQQQQQPQTIYYSSNISFTQNSSATRSFPKPLPIPLNEIKVEPVDLVEEDDEEERLSDEFEEINVSGSTETVAVGNTSSSNHNNPTPINTDTPTNRATNFTNDLMVIVNDDSLLTKSSKDGNDEPKSPNKRDREFINNYMQFKQKSNSDSPPSIALSTNSISSNSDVVRTEKSKDKNISDDKKKDDESKDKTKTVMNGGSGKKKMRSTELVKLLVDTKRISATKKLTADDYEKIKQSVELTNRTRIRRSPEKINKIEKSKRKRTSTEPTRSTEKSKKISIQNGNVRTSRSSTMKSPIK